LENEEELRREIAHLHELGSMSTDTQVLAELIVNQGVGKPGAEVGKWCCDGVVDRLDLVAAAVPASLTSTTSDGACGIAVSGTYSVPIGTNHDAVASVMVAGADIATCGAGRMCHGGQPKV
jgi:hypothetical protein